jgi:hypothetical protein
LIRIRYRSGKPVEGAQLALGKGGRVQVAWNGSDKATPKNPIEGSPMLSTRMKRCAEACRRCAEACRRCAASCREMAAGRTASA